jgi:nanoRNase/pAp phosphatase (c-di-AMP/oligoRNAs hydrolase)
MALDTKKLGRKRSDRLLRALAPFKNCLVVMHDNPDPDAIASGWGIHKLINSRLGKPVRLIGGGGVIRAENRHMVELLSPPMELVDGVDVPPDTATILVDCGPASANHLLNGCHGKPVAVIDHHPSVPRTNGIPFKDIRPQVAASATIAASYLREQEVEPDRKLAAAMIYAVRTETRGANTHYSTLDRNILTWLTARSEPSLVAEIENAPLAREYFADLVLAMQNTFVYDDAAFCMLPRASSPEIVAEVADLLIRDERLDRVLCGAAIKDDIFFSARTDIGCGDAARLLRATVNGLGRAGGHEHRAGGKAPGKAVKGRITEDMQDELRGRWLTACRVRRSRGTRLVAKSEIVDNL